MIDKILVDLVKRDIKGDDVVFLWVVVLIDSYTFIHLFKTR